MVIFRPFPALRVLQLFPSNPRLLQPMEALNKRGQWGGKITPPQPHGASLSEPSERKLTLTFLVFIVADYWLILAQYAWLPSLLLPSYPGLLLLVLHRMLGLQRLVAGLGSSQSCSTLLVNPRCQVSCNYRRIPYLTLASLSSLPP